MDSATALLELSELLAAIEADADRAWAAADADPATLGRHVFREDA